MIPSWLLPLNTEAFIAGGYAACPALATDMDVWVQVPDARVFAEMCQRLIAHFTNGGLAFAVEEPSTEVTGYENATCHVTKCAKVRASGNEYHIMVTDGDAATVLGGFDISTHMVALTNRGVVTIPPMTTRITETPIVWLRTPHTEQRLQKIMARYHLTGEVIYAREAQ